ncbi:antirestriction protein, partial [Saccharibacillus sp. O16]
MSNVIYQMITEKIMEKLKAGVIPWRQPWLANGIISWESQKAYRGVNLLLLDPGEYATLNQIKKAGGRVQSAEIKNYYRVIFWKMDKKTDEESGEEKLAPILRFYKVYNVGMQCEGIEPKRKTAGVKFENQPIEEAEAIVS